MLRYTYSYIDFRTITSPAVSHIALLVCTLPVLPPVKIGLCFNKPIKDVSCINARHEGTWGNRGTVPRILKLDIRPLSGSALFQYRYSRRLGGRFGDEKNNLLQSEVEPRSSPSSAYADYLVTQGRLCVKLNLIS